MFGYPGGRPTFLVAVSATHLLVGYTLGLVLADRPYAGAFGGIVADVDLLVPRHWGPPLAHRGITHSLLAAALVTGVAAGIERETGVAVGAGYASQLAMDATTDLGIPIASPLSNAAVGVSLGTHSAPGTVVLWIAALAVLLWHRQREGQRTEDAGG